MAHARCPPCTLNSIAHQFTRASSAQDFVCFGYDLPEACRALFPVLGDDELALFGGAPRVPHYHAYVYGIAIAVGLLAYCMLRDQRRRSRPHVRLADRVGMPLPEYESYVNGSAATPILGSDQVRSLLRTRDSH